jgi:hypothetical protein
MPKHPTRMRHVRRKPVLLNGTPNQIELFAGPGVERLNKQLKKKKAIPIYSDSEECSDNSNTGHTTAEERQQFPSKKLFFSNCLYILQLIFFKYLK